MIPFVPQPEPTTESANFDFDAEVRQKGNAWLRNTPDARTRKRPQPCWSDCLPHLRHAFRNLCGYAAMRIESKGTVDHFQSWARTKETRPELAYEWTNYRFCSASINSLKNKFDEDVLDPFEVQDGWFRVALPDMQLLLTDRVPATHRARAETTLTRLQLSHGEDLVEFWRARYDQYKERGEPILNMMDEWAPLVARAIREKLAAGERLP